jgi:2-haloacid dehalogenase
VGDVRLLRHADRLADRDDRGARGGPFLPYREVLARGLERSAKAAGVALDDYDVLGTSVETWKAFDDTVPMLERLRAAGWQLAILSNSDAAMLAGTLDGPLPLPFGEVIAADQVRSYKPAHGHFDTFAQRRSPDRWVHAGCSHFHDVVPAEARGLEAILIDREGAGDDLSKLVEALTRSPSAAALSSSSGSTARSG